MKLSTVFLLSAVLMLGVGIAASQDRDGRNWDSHDGYLQTVQYHGNNADFQRGYQDGINSGRADANDHKRFDLESHPYYNNSNDQAYRDGFAQGYREAYGQDRAHNGELGRVNTNNPEYQKGLQDGINSGRADANDHKRPDADAHPYYRNSNNEAYRAGFMQGYRDAYGEPR